MGGALAVAATAYGFGRGPDQPKASPVIVELPETEAGTTSRVLPPPPLEPRKAKQKDVVPAMREERRQPQSPRQLSVDLWSLAPVQDAVARALTTGEAETWKLGTLGGFVTATPVSDRACWTVLLWGRGWAQGESLSERRCASGIKVDEPEPSPKSEEMPSELASG
jgi:hypothetical protein